jgi:imidazolonepropionase
LGQTGGVQASIEHNALTVDHLESAGDEEIALLANSKTIPTVLPSVAFYLNMDYAPARKIIDSGCSIALATDYNPGSTPSGNFPFVISLACIKLGMLPEEAFNAATINGAYAMEVDEELGSITPGKKANVFITKKIPSYEFIPYAFGSQHVDQVIINGKIT